MLGPHVITSSIQECRIVDKRGNEWQYHSRSDRHSKIACVAIAFDLLANSAALRKHAQTGEVIVGVNHEMRDFTTGRKKNLDLVIATPGSGDDPEAFPDLNALMDKYGLVLSPAGASQVHGLPNPKGGHVGAVRLALEAKACMTAFTKSRPRLYDELTSSHQTVHGSSDAAIAGGFAMVNASEEFVSPVKNTDRKNNAVDVNTHPQPVETQKVLEKLRELPRRTAPGTVGFDALGVMVVHMRNDFGPVEVVDGPPAPDRSDILHYDQMIRRLGQLYDTKYPAI